jgi:hypothetical protein
MATTPSPTRGPRVLPNNIGASGHFLVKQRHDGRSKWRIHIVCMVECFSVGMPCFSWHDFVGSNCILACQ